MDCGAAEKFGWANRTDKASTREQQKKPGVNKRIQQGRNREPA